MPEARSIETYEGWKRSDRTRNPISSAHPMSGPVHGAHQRAFEAYRDARFTGEWGYCLERRHWEAFLRLVEDDNDMLAKIVKAKWAEDDYMKRMEAEERQKEHDGVQQGTTSKGQQIDGDQPKTIQTENDQQENQEPSSSARV